MSEQTATQKNRGISPIWTLPILAIIICFWLLYKSYLEAGIEIQVYFDDASGITPAKTQVMYMGIPLGLVVDIEPDLDKRKVVATVKMDRSTEEHLVEDTRFWLVKPEVSADRITGLDTLFSGSYIGVQPGSSTKKSSTFMALPTAPPVPQDAAGLHIYLKSAALRSIQEGSAIYFKNIRIGSVQAYQLKEDETISIRCHILPEYSHLIRVKSRFYDASGISISGQLTNLKVRMESIASLFTGGIVVSTPENQLHSTLAKNGDSFQLYEDYKASNYGLSMKLKLASGKNIIEGVTKVMYRGIEAGFVKRITINDDERRSVTAHILLDPRAEIVLREKTTFWLVSPELSIAGVNNLNTMFSGSYITFAPGGGEYRDHFEILPEPPIDTPLRPGKTYRLNSTGSTLLEPGAPVYHLNVQIGEIIGRDLSADRNAVDIQAFIYEKYSDIITVNSVFLQESGISIKADISGISLSADPMLAILKGGVEVVTPSVNGPPSGPADENHLFTLYSRVDEAIADNPSLKPKGLYILLEAENLGSYRIGSPILFKKMKVGRIVGFSLVEGGEKVRISCLIEPEYEHLVTTDSRFFNISGVRLRAGSGGIQLETASVESLVSGGIAFTTGKNGRKVSDRHIFAIHPSREAAKELDNIGIVVSFDDAGPLNVDAAVKYNGIQLGTVRDVEFGDNLQTVYATLSIDKNYEKLFRQNTRIWLAQPRISLRGVRNLETAIFGSFVAIQPGTGKLNRSFKGINTPPLGQRAKGPGLHIILEAKHLNSIDIGAPIYYRRVKVGEVTGYDLAFDFRDVLIYATIEEQYAPIVRQNTRFWNASGVTVQGGLFSGISVSTQSMDAIMAGGIAMATPNKEEMGPPVASGIHFLLHDKVQPGWLDWSPDIFSIAEEDGTLPAR